MKLVHWDPIDFLDHLSDTLAVYGAAMNYPDSVVHARRKFFAGHAHRPGFRAVATMDDTGTVLGFGYGYTSTEGQWPHEQIKTALAPDAYQRWMTDCFELVELHVAPNAQGRGAGHQQIVELLTDLPHRTVVLTTPEAPEESNRAWRLYRRLGFQDMARHFYFPGDGRPFAILGRDLPL